MQGPEHRLAFSQIGANHGRLIVYFHGAPGAPCEIDAFDQAARLHVLRIVCLDRFALTPSLTGEAYYQCLARAIDHLAGDWEPVFVGFSIGAFIALQTSRQMTHRVRHLHLVSAAAPLDAGDFLPAMAGKQVFTLAKNFPALFRLLSAWQGLLARYFPTVLFRMLFASATGADRALAADSDFQTAMIRTLRSGFAGRVHGYVRDVSAYVQPWRASLANIATPVSIWHGDADTWSPPAMADCLDHTPPAATSTRRFSGLSHYSCLQQAMDEICAASAREASS